MDHSNPDHECIVSDAQVGFGSNQNNYINHINMTDPDGNGPVGDALISAMDLFTDLPEEGSAKAVVLVVDGPDTCGGDAVDMIKKLRSRGIDVWVMAFDTSTDVEWLNNLADLGEHPLTGAVKYRSLADSGALEYVMAEIEDATSEEICDGQDNDCDGFVDENLYRNCALTCGGGYQGCVMGEWGPCVPAEEAEGYD